MPNHKIHETTGIITSPVVAVGMYHFTESIAITGITLAVYIAATYYLSPDLDHDVGAASYKRWGIFRFIWYPYKQLVKHRSWVSHSGPISATIKLLYLVVWLLPLYYILPQYILLLLLPYCGILWIAVSLSDTVHVLMDLLWKEKHG